MSCSDESGSDEGEVEVPVVPRKGLCGHPACCSACEEAVEAVIILTDPPEGAPYYFKHEGNRREEQGYCEVLSLDGIAERCWPLEHHLECTDQLEGKTDDEAVLEVFEGLLDG